MKQEIELTVLLPCLNEAETLATVIKKAQKSIIDLNIRGEVVIADNGSTDGSQKIAEDLGAKLLTVSTRGYGAALIAGIAYAEGKYVVMGDADDSYELDQLGPFLEKLREGSDLVIGNRFKGGIAEGAMPWLHKWVGNPVLSWLGRKLFKTSIGDFHCGLRAFNRQKMLALSLKCNGMGFASEMIVKASINEFNITEVPTTLHKDGRSRPPHLRTWRDGWRHLIFLLAASPRYAFLVPAVICSSIGVIGMVLTGFGVVDIGNRYLDLNTYFLSVGILLTGVQLFLTAILVRIFSTQFGFLPTNSRLHYFQKKFTLERGIVLGVFMQSLSLTLSILLLFKWNGHGFHELNSGQALRITGLILVLFSSGMQIIFASFFASLMQS